MRLLLALDPLSPPSLPPAPPPPIYAQMDSLVHQFKGSSASFGARTMTGLCLQLRDACHAQDLARIQPLVAQLRDSFVRVRGCLDQFMVLERQRKQLGGGQ